MSAVRSSPMSRRAASTRVREWALELDGVEPARAVPDAASAAARGAARRSPTASAAGTRLQRPADVELEVEPGVGSSGAGCRSTRSASTSRANLVSTLVMCAVPAQVAGVERIVVVHAAVGRGLVAAAAEALGLDEVWALGGPQAIGWLAYVERVDKIVGPGNSYVNEAKLEVVARRRDRPARRAVRGRRRRRGRRPRSSSSSSRRRPEHGPDAVCRRVATPRARPSDRARAPRAARRCRGARAATVRNAGAVFVGPSSPVAAGDYATGGNHVLPTGGWARSVGGLGLETFLKPVTVQRLTREGLARAAPDRRGARRGRGHAGARGGGAAMRDARRGVHALHAGRRRRARSRSSQASTRRRSLRFDQNTPPLPLPSTRPGTIAGALADVNTLSRTAATRDLRAAIARYAGVEPENVVARRGRRRPDPALRPRLRRPGRHRRDPGAPTYPLYRIAARARGRRGAATDDPRSPSAAARTTRRASSARSRMRGRSSSTRRTSSTRRDRASALIDDGVVVLRTFSKAFALAGARIGYALAARDVAAELTARQAPAPVSSLSAALALAALAIAARRRTGRRGARAARRRRCARSASSRSPSRANFLFVPVDDGRALGDALLRRDSSCACSPTAIRASVRDREDDDLLVEALARLLDRPSPVAAAGGRRSRLLRATAETRLSRAARARRRRPRARAHRRRSVRPPARAARVPCRVRPRARRRRRPRDRRPPHGRGRGARVREALDSALGDRRGIARYGDAVVPMDDALARAAVDLGGRAFAELQPRARPGPRRRTCSRASRRRRAHRDPRPGDRPRPAPRRRGGVQGSRPGVARRRPRRERPGCRRRRGSL